MERRGLILLSLLALTLSLASANSFVDLEDGLELRGDSIYDAQGQTHITLSTDQDGVTVFQNNASFRENVSVRGNLNLDEGNISGASNIEDFFGQDCLSDVAENNPNGYVVVDITDRGDLVCENLDPRYYNLEGDSLGGNLDASGNELNNIGSISSNNSVLNVEDDLKSSGRIVSEQALVSNSGEVTSNEVMCIGNQC